MTCEVVERLECSPILYIFRSYRHVSLSYSPDKENLNDLLIAKINCDYEKVFLVVLLQTFPQPLCGRRKVHISFTKADKKLGGTETVVS